jgi:hypothetical protein
MSYPNSNPGYAGKILIPFVLIAVFIIGFAVTGILNLYLTKQTQTTESQAQTLSPIQDARCINAGGECQTGKRNQVGKPCSLTDGTRGTVLFNYCPSQGDDIRCCAPNSVPISGSVDNTSDFSGRLTVRLQGIGPSADIRNQTRTATVKLFKNSGNFDQFDYQASGELTYDPASGNFVNNNFSLGRVEKGDYKMVIQMQKYLDKELLTPSGSDVFTLGTVSAIEIAPVTLRAGDIAPGERGDNSVDIIDYNVLLGCLPTAPPGSCLNRDFADLNDDGLVDQEDMDILLENFNRKGFAFKTDQFKCEQDPACESGKDSLQLCTLVCERISKRS